MSKTLQVHLLPELTTPEALRGATVVVIDVLRATTTITHALAAGARDVIPFEQVEQIHARAIEFDREQIVLGGERLGVKIDLFDLGNSPAEYTSESVGGKSVLFTTTNGTQALARCRQAYQVLIGGHVNLSAVCRALAGTLNVHLVCAGTRGEVTREDILAAGAITYKLTRDETTAPEINDAAHVARAAWRGVVAGAVGHGEPLSERLAKEFRATAGGRNLLALGLEDDLAAAAAVDAFDLVPVLDTAAWRIHLP